MATFSWRLHERASQVTLLVVNLLVCSLSAHAEPGIAQGFPLRNQNPFPQIFGLPPFQSATLTSERTQTATSALTSPMMRMPLKTHSSDS